MVRRFTRKNVLELFRQWPQAVNADEGDLRVLHDMANAGAQLWRESLPWPDYLWLDFDEKFRERTITKARNEVYFIENPASKTQAATFAVEALSMGSAELPPSGQFALTNSVIAMVELRVLEANIATKLSSYKPAIPWDEFIRLKLDHRFREILRDADNQIAGGKRLLPFPNARGVLLLVNEGSRDLESKVAIGYLARALKGCPNLNAIVYCVDKPGGYTFARIVRERDDTVLNRFLTQALMMVSGFTYDSGLPVHRIGPQPNLVARIEMDKRSRSIYRSWCSGWRVVGDPTPAPSPSMAVSFVRREEFVSGLPPTRPDSNLLDCRIAWDRDGGNLRVENR
jgi:hypothetical protein